MKKILFSLVVMATMLFTSCNKCSQSTEPTDEDTVVVDTTEMVVENLISLDRQDMYLHYSEDYRWYETCILLKDYLDEDCDGTIQSVTNVFQAVYQDSPTTADVYVVFYTHTPDTSYVESKQGFWVEDCVLNDEEIKLTYEDAFNKILEVNAVKPHSRNCILRKPIGPQDCNPQYVFGNISEQLWVDAVTGEVKTSDPSFPDNFAKPLGEWP